MSCDTSIKVWRLQVICDVDCAQTLSYLVSLNTDPSLHKYYLFENFLFLWFAEGISREMQSASSSIPKVFAFLYFSCRSLRIVFKLSLTSSKVSDIRYYFLKLGEYSFPFRCKDVRIKTSQWTGRRSNTQTWGRPVYQCILSRCAPVAELEPDTGWITCVQTWCQDFEIFLWMVKFVGETGSINSI